VLDRKVIMILDAMQYWLPDRNSETKKKKMRGGTKDVPDRYLSQEQERHAEDIRGAARS